MHCHICGKEMRVISVDIVQQNDVIKETIETWRCDDCDGFRGITKRALKGHWPDVLAIMVFIVLVLVPFVAFVLYAITARIP